MTRKKQTNDRGGYDRFLLLGVLLLLGIGIVMVYSASSIVATKRFGSHTFFFYRHLVHALVAILVLVCCRYVPYSFYRTLVYPILGIALMSLIALYVPGVGHTVGGAKRWVRLFDVSFQPSEFARLALIIYLAYSMSKKQEKIKAFSVGFLPHAILFALFSILIVMQPDFGMAAMIALIVWIMLFVGGVRLSYLFAALGLPSRLHIMYLSMRRTVWKDSSSSGTHGSTRGMPDIRLSILLWPLARAAFLGQVLEIVTRNSSTSQSPILTLFFLWWERNWDWLACAP